MTLRLYTCPCCDKQAPARTQRLTRDECIRAFAKMMGKGWTAQRLLDERTEDMDALAPGLTDWLRWWISKERDVIG